MQAVIYDYMNSDKSWIKTRNAKANTYDMLGFLDKDAEKYYASFKTTATTKPNGAVKIEHEVMNTTNTVDLYDNMYEGGND